MPTVEDDGPGFADIAETGGESFRAIATPAAAGSVWRSWLRLGSARDGGARFTVRLPLTR